MPVSITRVPAVNPCAVIVKVFVDVLELLTAFGCPLSPTAPSVVAVMVEEDTTVSVPESQGVSKGTNRTEVAALAEPSGRFKYPVIVAIL